MGACGASGPALGVLSARWVHSAWPRVTVGLESPLGYPFLGVFMELSELSGFGTFNATISSLSRVFPQVMFPPVCF